MPFADSKTQLVKNYKDDFQNKKFYIALSIGDVSTVPNSSEQQHRKFKQGLVYVEKMKGTELKLGAVINDWTTNTQYIPYDDKNTDNTQSLVVSGTDVYKCVGAPKSTPSTQRPTGSEYIQMRSDNYVWIKVCSVGNITDVGAYSSPNVRYIKELTSPSTTNFSGIYHIDVNTGSLATLNTGDHDLKDGTYELEISSDYAKTKSVWIVTFTKNAQNQPQLTAISVKGSNKAQKISNFGEGFVSPVGLKVELKNVNNISSVNMTGLNNQNLEAIFRPTIVPSFSKDGTFGHSKNPIVEAGVDRLLIDNPLEVTTNNYFKNTLTKVNINSIGLWVNPIDESSTAEENMSGKLSGAGVIPTTEIGKVVKLKGLKSGVLETIAEFKILDIDDTDNKVAYTTEFQSKPIVEYDSFTSKKLYHNADDNNWGTEIGDYVNYLPPKFVNMSGEVMFLDDVKAINIRYEDGKGLSYAREIKIT